MVWGGNVQELIGKTLGQYQVTSAIGGGGMAVVYKAWQASLGRYVALKVLPSQLALDTTLVQRFRREAQAAAQLAHPNIVPIYEVGEADGIHYIAMEYLEGTDLAKVIAGEGALPLKRVVHIVEQISAALDYAHSRGYVHRDVKPSNIFIGRNDKVTLTDFGIAKAGAASRLTRTGAIMGTPEYMSPEQTRGRDVDLRTDVYSLGVVCYEMLTGRIPFVGETPAVLHAHAYETPPPLRRWEPSIPSGVEDAVLRALSKEKDDRYQRAGELAKALSSPASALPKARPRAEERPAVVAQPEARAVARPSTRPRRLRLGRWALLLLMAALLFAFREPVRAWLETTASQIATPIARRVTSSPTAPRATERPDAVVHNPGRGLNLRQGPSMDHEIIVWMPHGEALEIVGRDPDYPDWLRVRRSNGQVGWSSTDLMIVYRSLQSIPVTSAVTATRTQTSSVFEVRYRGCVPHASNLGVVKGQVFDRDGQVIPGAWVEIAIGGQRWDSPANPAVTNGAGWYEWNLSVDQQVTFLSLTVGGREVVLQPESLEVVSRSGCFQHVDFQER